MCSLVADARWYGKIWYGKIWYGKIWYGKIWYGKIWYGKILTEAKRWLHSV